MPDDERLRIIALDAEDLAILSAHVQDAVLKVKDIRWLPREGHFVVAMNRFAWEAAVGGSWTKREYVRRRSVLHFARAGKVQSTGIDRARSETVLNLLAVTFEPTESPSGEIVLAFADGAAIRIFVEAIEAELTDLGPAWSTPHAPRHPGA